MMKNIEYTPEKALSSGRRTIQAEAQALMDLHDRLDNSFSNAIALLLACQGRVVVMGLGKSGHIGRKISATLASTGTPSFFVHSGEAVHGDLGMVTGRDIVIAISYSGNSNELSTVLPVVRRLGTKVIAICGHPQSDLAKLCDVFLDASIQKEACPLNLAPTTSTTVALALGDALAVTCLEARNFGESDFARSHPGGALGRRLLTYVRDVMRQGDDLPLVSPDIPLPQALKEMSLKRMGMTAVVNDNNEPVGIFTDGDLRRLIVRHGDIRHFTMHEVMTSNPKSIAPDELAVEAASLMEKNKLSHMLVVDKQGTLVGAMHMHDLMVAKVI
ncbi:KpsF/GutQ family sugar-phosphate isomerase [Advenella alkanexedens]|jgi:arabinose-5-phosphate isomerase|uniref:KpsF/GutQ family sugar-phosphate isomerase n=1 Tax=Advenella alkanexedens TaxID=1481665 RepID=A0ABS6NR42_9BURK|nr:MULTISPECIES: KpsF/GutQ family sugar-phosphate isomerase [Advenella]MBV4398094.1 KpsF/GutQ family sugar-phosphate isomerase [Advenella alkanexedens]MDD3758425.1 KpsF/GutQ family sugar-phosphate isomerase [Advenella sp.]NLN67061.1 KpsF/GutQ family sugar-phosphate isomerase [Alcaligenaceae bacterium]WKU19318.1 KpsF/GutQ family sugar-phosphate isomerase [Advenella alkanexedens]